MIIPSRPLSSTTSLQPLLASESSDNSYQRSLSNFSNVISLTPRLYLPPRLSPLPLRVHCGVHCPYAFPPIEARLPAIDSVSLSLHIALHNFHPITPDYAEAPYAEAFNWDELTLPEEEEREWYCVTFRSRRKTGSNSESLYEADRLAHQEAVKNGGLIMYWYGEPNPQTRTNLATCIWQSSAQAHAANTLHHHTNAVRLARACYETYELGQWVLRKEKGNTRVSIEPCAKGQVVGW